MIQLKNISFQVENKMLLNQINFDVKDGELLVIMGNNGAGKTTLLNLMCGETKPTEGTIHFEEKSICDFCSKDLSKMRAVMRQQTHINLPFTAKEIVMMGRYPYFKTRETPEDIIIVDEAMELLSVSHLADRNFLTLSGGEKQRVHLARVFAQLYFCKDSGNKTLFLDEPTNNLDISHQFHTLQLLRTFVNKGNTAVAILHDLNLAAMFADRIVLLKNGKLVGLGTPSEILSKSIVSDTFNFPAIIEKHPQTDIPTILYNYHIQQN